MLVCTLTICRVYTHWVREKERNGPGQMEGQREKRHGQMGGSDGEESKERLSHVRKRCGEDTV